MTVGRAWVWALLLGGGRALVPVGPRLGARASRGVWSGNGRQGLRRSFPAPPRRGGGLQRMDEAGSTVSGRGRSVRRYVVEDEEVFEIKNETGEQRGAMRRGGRGGSESSPSSSSSSSSSSKKKTSTLILLRHGESIWNVEEDERFTGWTDVPLSTRGAEEAKAAAKMLKDHGVVVDKVFTSVLSRARDTARVVFDQCGRPETGRLEERWRLNERHYGALQGYNKKDLEKQLGSDLVQEWRRSFDAVPPTMTEDHALYDDIYNDPRYTGIPFAELPKTESVEMCLARLSPVWRDEIAPALAQGEVVCVCAHANSLRALLKHIYLKSEGVLATVRALRIPTGVPFIYNLERRSCETAGDSGDDDAEPCILGPDPSQPLYEFIPQPAPEACGSLQAEWLFPLEECPVLWDDYHPPAPALMGSDTDQRQAYTNVLSRNDSGLIAA